MKVQIGTWVEKTPRKETYCPSYYAADTKTHVTKPGRYPLYVEFVGGYNIPMPYWLLALIRVQVTGGAYYSGFCGNNFAKDDIKPVEDEGYTIQMHAYTLKDLVIDGRAEVLPEFDWLLKEQAELYAYMAEKHIDWSTLEALEAAKTLALVA